MEWKWSGFLLPLLLVLSAKGTDLPKNESSPDIRGPRASKRVVRLYSGTRPKPIVCAGEGFQADPTDCSIFHRCMRTGNGRYVSFRFQCGPGTIYDSDKEICSHPQNTKRTECGSNHVPRVEISFDNEISKEVPSPLSTKLPEGTEKYEFLKQTTKKTDYSSLASKYPWLSTTHQFLNPAVSTYIPSIDKRLHTKSPKASSIKREVTTSAYTTTSLKKDFSTTVKIDFQNSASRSGDICTSDGFMGDSENCRKFYRCISNQRGLFLRYEFMCSDPTIWDDDKQACNHVWAVKRRRCGRGNYIDTDTRQNVQVASSEYPIESAILPTQSQLQINYGSKVTQVQTQISNGSVIQNQTQINYGDSTTYDMPGILQNQSQISAGDAVSQTQTQINYGNEAVQTQLQIDHSKNASQAQTQISQSTSTSKTTQFNAHQSISTTSSNNGCTESGFMGDSKDCKKFYRCVDTGRGSFNRYEFTCGEGTVWDPKIEACNHAWAVKECGGKVPTETSTQSSTITTQSTTTISQSSPTFSTSTTTTQSYYSPTDPEPEDNNDISYGNQPVSASTNKPITTSEQVTGENKEPHNPSDNKCTSSGFMGDSKDCKKFYRCVDNGNRGYIQYEFACGEGTVWDQSIEACNHAWAVKNCGNNAEVEKQTEKSTTTTNGIPTTNAQTTSQTPSQNDDFDTGYGQQPQHDEISSTFTTTTAVISTTLQASSSSSSSNVESTCTSSGFMGDKNDCKKFYRCVDNGNGGYNKYEFSCGEGTVWDSKIQACNHAWAVEKCGGSTVEDINKEEMTTLKETVMSSSSTPVDVPDNNNDAGHSQENQEPQSTSSPTSQPELQNLENNDCKNSGFMGDEQDCNKFYRCVDDGRGAYTRYEFTCGEGTVWDQSIEACNHAWAVRRRCSGSGSYNDSSEANPATPTYTTSIETEGEDQGYQKPATETTSSSTSLTSAPSGSQCTQEGFYGDVNNCKIFYRCVDNGQGGFIKHEFTCGEGTVWNQDIQTCDHESSNIQCSTHASGSTTKQPNKDDDEMLTESTTKTSVMSTTNDGNMNYTSHKPQPSGNKCENEGFYGDPTDCKKFYRCVDNGKGDFTKYDFTCGDGTIWDQEILACNHENSDNKCSFVSSTTTTGAPEKEPGGSQTTQESQTTQKPGIITDPGNDQCTMEGFFANTNDCNKFYRCVDNEKGGFSKYDFACGEGTVWVQEIQACDYDNGISSCSNNNSSSRPTTIKDEKPTTLSSSTSLATTESQHVDKEDDEYPSESSSKLPETDEKCTSEGFFGNKNDCTRFYRCVDNGQGGYTKYDFTCGEGTAWDLNIQTCNHINEVESCQNTNESSQSKPNDEGSTQTSEPTSKPSSSSSNNDKCEEEGYFGNKNDCTMFYRCVDNGKGGYTKYDFTCGEGTIWDQDLLTCNHPQNVVSPSCNNSEDGQSSSENSISTENSSSTTSQSSQGTTESSNQGSSNCSQESTSKKPENQKVKCEKAGFFADPDDCKKFYRCVDWDGDGKRFSIYHFDCGEGTIWDPQLETCNHEDSVYPPRDCSGSQSGNVSGETASSSTTTTTEKSTTYEQSSTTESTTTTQASTEESTTQQSSSSEQTTQQLTTEKTTTEESSSSEQTTTEKTTTTQQSTSTEKTTTQQPTTSEKTTSQPTTSEQTTTEQMTTSQQQTTQETTTSQQTTTQHTTSSEATTTEQTTTTDQTTTQYTTTEQTTQSITTKEPTTQSSSTETQQPTTTEENSPDSSTTEQQTTTTEQSSTTTEQSTEQNTTEYEKTTTEGSTTTTESVENTTTESNQGTTAQETSSSEKECPETEDDQYMYVCPTSFRRHPKYCNMFYQCTEDNDSHDVKVTMFKCPNNTIYDESKTQCVEEDKADKKCDGQTVQRHRVKRLNSNFKEPIEASREKHTCSTVGNYPYETDNECSGIFLKCQATKSGKLRAYVYRCPEGYTYWSISKRCEKTNHMRDCKQSGRSWRDRWEVPIEKKNIAK